MDLTDWRRSLVLIALGVFIAQVAFSLVIPFLPMFLQELGVVKRTSFWSGIIYSITFVAAGIMSPVWGSLADRHGKRPMILRAGVGMAITYGLMAVVTNHIQLLALRFLNGLVSGFIPAATMLVACACPEEQLALSLGTVQAIGAAGAITGPLLGGVLTELVGIRASMLIAALVLVLASLFPVLGVREEVNRGEAYSTVSADIRAALGNPSLRALFIIVGLAQAAVLTTQPTLPLWVQRLVPERAELITGVVFSVVGIATVIGSPLVTRLRGVDYRVILGLSLLASSLFSAAQGVAHSPWSLAGMRFFFGLGNAGVTVAANTLVARGTSRAARGRALGVLNSFIYLGSVVGPFAGGAVGDRFGLTSSFYAGAVLLVGAALLQRIWWRSIVPYRPERSSAQPLRSA